MWFASDCFSYNFPVNQGLHACLGSARFKSQWRQRMFCCCFLLLLFYVCLSLNCVSQINIALNISVAMSLMANLLQLYHWKQHCWHYTKTNWFIISQPSPFWHSETKTNSAPSVLWLLSQYCFKTRRTTLPFLIWCQ
jgi:hypothetical protein